MDIKRVCIGLIVLLWLGCNTPTKKSKLETWKQEIRDTEKAFSNMAQKEGVAKAFETYCANDVVMMRNNKLVKGKDGLKTYFSHQTSSSNFKLSWAPDFVDVSSSGDLGYTYGKYQLTYKDSTGAEMQNTGVFHTVWKRQPDQTWKFVWD
ncbi:YybH family protein [Flagellimonas aequoris]|uniref:Nuclear transport factor 2 family protein n=1 Tax=Flagellimonas aequoris TaxID=2306997 RepID=A0A418N4Q7_9FLAO|nr:nuclear transport factor 2 family protein [Allomuricauda aequoris]RIV68749.1 nuclear transport factor 2 family protein [Allomuricauda aequoris]TXK00447.1 nuclear transport factor 2 family protein [Allomuricauda aequoris]